MSYLVQPFKIEDSRFVCVISLTYGRARMCVGPNLELIDDAW